MQSNFPEIIDIKQLRDQIDSGFDWLVMNWGEQLETAFYPLLDFLSFIESSLIATPWWLMLSAISALAYAASRNIRMTLLVAVMTFLLGVLGYWQPAMATIALMLVSTLVAVVLGIPLGILMSRSNRFEALSLPVLDIMQTMPIFVYLIPFVMLFGPGKIPALMATVVFAIPPVIRLTNLGIRQVDGEIVEAVTAFGASDRQKLLSVQLPLAMPTIMAGINQTTMMALSMVVIASMIGAGGLGYQVLQGIQRLEVSRGLFAGVAIVLLAIIFDRIVQSFGQRTQQHLHIGGGNG